MPASSCDPLLLILTAALSLLVGVGLGQRLTRSARSAIALQGYVQGLRWMRHRLGAQWSQAECDTYFPCPHQQP